MKDAMRSTAEAIVAGHICLDIIPRFPGTARGDLAGLIAPGKLTNVGPAVIATGGAVSNTGLALHRLSTPTRLMGKIGADLFGNAILDRLRAYDATLVEGMIVEEGEDSSYTIVINPPGIDRAFLHCPGANDTFRAQDVPLDRLTGARLFHFGYPPIMRRMFADNGAELVSLMARVKEVGLTTSLDTAYPDPNSEAGRADWVTILERTLPHIDLFLPSLDEILYMIDRPRWRAFDAGGRISGDLLRRTSSRLLAMGAAVVVLKLGDQGLYVRTTADPERLRSAGRAAPTDRAVWLDRELLAPCFRVDVKGTTGAGDCTIAGFLAGLLRGLPLAEATRSAVAVGACSVEHPDATGGVPTWQTVQDRIAAGWDHRPCAIDLGDWQWREDAGLWLGPDEN